MKRKHTILLACLVLMAIVAFSAWASVKSPSGTSEFPPALASYHDSGFGSITNILINRVRQHTFNLIATLIFLCAIVHTFLASKFMMISHEWKHRHEELIRSGDAEEHSVDIGAEIFHFLGEVEVVFGLWAVVLIAAILLTFGWPTVISYFEYKVNLTEAAFVVVIMTLASTRPILKLAESFMLKVAAHLGGSLAALWLTILTLGPLLGSFITEPAAITICALVLSQKFYELRPNSELKYATLGLLFVNVSVGGTLTHFAAPPVLMVAGPWGWGTVYMMAHFGWKAILGILISNGVYFVFFRKEFERMQEEFALRTLKARIETRFVTRKLVDKEFNRIKVGVEKEERYIESVNSETELFLSRVRERME
ncbi:MAG: putative Na+/H+ antiporter, partial [Thermodesulfobacteriota bacterium]